MRQAMAKSISTCCSGATVVQSRRGVHALLAGLRRSGILSRVIFVTPIMPGHVLAADWREYDRGSL